MTADKRVILITGSSGLIGQTLINHFAGDDTVVVGFDKESPSSRLPRNTEFVYCDLRSDESVHQSFRIFREKYGNKITAVMHLAAYYSFSGEKSPLYQELTVDGTGRMLKELKGFDVGQFIFSSSMLVHEPNKPGELISEISPISPTWDYPESKAKTEALIDREHGNIPAVILRIAGCYSNKCQSIPIAHQIQRIYEGQLEGHLYSGNPDVKQSFVHIDDLAQAFENVLASANALPSETVLLIGEPRAMSYDEIQKEVALILTGDDWKTFAVPKPIAKVGAFIENELPTKNKPFIKPWMIDRADDNYELNISQAEALIGWKPQHHLHDTIYKMVEGLRHDPLKWYDENHLVAPGMAQGERVQDDGIAKED